LELLTVSNISKSYNAHQALDDISLSIPHQCIFGLLGPNGAGKTTLIRIINRIIRPDAGRVFLNGEEMTDGMVRKIGYLPEERGLYKKMKVAEQLLYLARLKGMSARDARRKIRFWLEKLELSIWWNKNIEDLSKGMAQKVQFIATVIHEPDLIILDEPFSGFDPVNADLIKNEILELRKNGSTVIFSTHRMESVEELCDDIAMINRSRKVLEGSKSEIRNRHRTGTYQVDFKGQLQTSGKVKISSMEALEGGLTRALVKDPSAQNPNQLLQKLIEQVEVHGFAEKIPSINEIFISNVK